MFEHMLDALTHAGWQLQKSNGWHYATYDQQGIIFGYLSNLDQDWWPILQEQKQVGHWQAIIFCPQGLDSSYLRRSIPERLQFWYWDMQTGEVFPYPPTRDFSVIRWIEEIARGEPANPLWIETKKKQWISAGVTYFIIGLNILIFLLMSVAGGSTNQDILIRFGAKVNTLVKDGQVWRLITSAFIHIGILHLGFNMYALWTLGPLAEEIFGHWRFLTIYLLSAVGGATASYLFSPDLSAGASGAIFGLLGALLANSWRHRQLWHNGLGLNLLVVIGVNLFFGLIQPGIDNYAHLGGLLVGLLNSLLFSRKMT